MTPAELLEQKYYKPLQEKKQRAWRKESRKNYAKCSELPSNFRSDPCSKWTNTARAENDTNAMSVDENEARYCRSDTVERANVKRKQLKREKIRRCELQKQKEQDESRLKKTSTCRQATPNQPMSQATEAFLVKMYGSR
jgi:hypothetical protein